MKVPQFEPYIPYVFSGINYFYAVECVGFCRYLYGRFPRSGHPDKTYDLHMVNYNLKVQHEPPFNLTWLIGPWHPDCEHRMPDLQVMHANGDLTESYVSDLILQNFCTRTPVYSLSEGIDGVIDI